MGKQRKSVAATILALLAIVLVTLAAYVIGYFCWGSLKTTRRFLVVQWFA